MGGTWFFSTFPKLFFLWMKILEGQGREPKRWWFERCGKHGPSPWERGRGEVGAWRFEETFLVGGFKYFLMFNPTWEMMQFDYWLYFSNGLKPPTSCWAVLQLLRVLWNADSLLKEKHVPYFVGSVGWTNHDMKMIRMGWNHPKEAFAWNTCAWFFGGFQV